MMKQKYLPIAIWITAFFILLAVPFKTGATPLEEEIDRVVNGLLPALADQGKLGVPISLSERMKALNIPGLSIAVINNGEVAWARGFGIQNKEDQKPVTPNTLFQSGSVSKPVAALGVLSLVEDGELDLDRDVNSYLRSWKISENEFTAKEKVTLRRLLTHSAGLTVHGFPGYSDRDNIPDLVQVLEGEAPANTAKVQVDQLPGAGWRYSGGGYTVMQQLVNDITQAPFHETMQKLVLGPIEMNDSTYEQPLPLTMQKETATGYYARGDEVENRYHTYPEKAAAGLWTTPSDLAKYAIEVQETVAGRSRRVIGQDLAKQMLTRRVQGRGPGQGLGPGLEGSGETERFSHGGVNAGFDTMMVGYVNEGKGAVLMSNSNNGLQLFPEILDSIARVYEWRDYKLIKQRETISITPEEMKKYEGEYASDDVPFDLELKISNGLLYGQVPVQGSAFLLTPLSEVEFVYPQAGIKVIFSKGDDGAIGYNEFTISQRGQSNLYTRKRNE